MGFLAFLFTFIGTMAAGAVLFVIGWALFGFAPLSDAVAVGIACFTSVAFVQSAKFGLEQ